MGEEIRLRYVGIVQLIAKIVVMLTGLMFTIIVVRRLSLADFGTWQWISRLIGYATIPVSIINFWVWRFVSRDHSNSKTALALNSVISIPVLLVYVVLIPLSAGLVQSGTYPFLVAAALVPLSYIVLTLWTIAGGIKPQDPAYCEMAYGATKVVSAIILVMMLNLALVGTIISFEIATVVQLVLFMVLVRKYLGGKFKRDVAKQWISYSWLSTYISQSTILIALDSIVIVMLTGAQATVVLAYFMVGATVSTKVGMAAGLSYALTPKLLKGGKATDVEVVLKLTLLFGIPMLVGTIVLVRPFTYLYGPAYLAVVNIANLLTISVFVDLVASIAETVLIGTVDIDKGKPSFKELARSRLSLLPSINILMSALYLVVLYLVLSSYISSWPIDPVQVGFLWAIVLFSIKLPFVFLKFLFAKRALKFNIPYKDIGKYCFAAAIMGIVLLFLLQYVVYYTSIYQFIIYPLILVGVGALIYLLTMFVIDKDFRRLARALLRMTSRHKHNG